MRAPGQPGRAASAGAQRKAQARRAPSEGGNGCIDTGIKYGALGFEPYQGEGSGTRIPYRGLFAVSVLVAMTAMLAAPAVADTYTVNMNPFTESHELYYWEVYDSFELTAGTGDSIKYSVSSQIGCVYLLLVQGHNANAQSSMYTDYSWTDTCTQSFTKTFVVPSGEGTEFSIVIINPSTVNDVLYTMNIQVTQAPAGFPIWLILVIVVAIAAVVIVVVLLMLRSRKQRAATVMQSPPPYPGQQPMYQQQAPPPQPQYPQQGWPPQQPPQPPQQGPPPYGP